MKLVYPPDTPNGREMKLEPVNRSLKECRDFIKMDEPQVVILEPGDGTRYTLLLTPVACEGIARHLGDFGIPYSARGKYYLLTKLSDRQSLSCWIRITQHIDVYDVEHITENRWTRIFIAWWLNEVFDHEWEVDYD